MLTPSVTPCGDKIATSSWMGFQDQDIHGNHLLCLSTGALATKKDNPETAVR